MIERLISLVPGHDVAKCMATNYMYIKRKEVGTNWKNHLSPSNGLTMSVLCQGHLCNCMIMKQLVQINTVILQLHLREI